VAQTFYEVITAAVADITLHGYDSQARIDGWVQRIRAAAVAAMTPPEVLEAALKGTLSGVYHRMITQQGVFKLHPGIFDAERPTVARFKLERIKPQLRAELDRRLMTSANLIRLNRQAMIEKTNQRFQGWATSIPPGGSKAVDKPEVKTDIRKALAQLPFEERRVAIDQGHKLAADLNNIIATDGGAIALTWHSHWRQPGYNYREDHKERDGNVYLLRNSWAHKAGLVRPGPAGYYDSVTAVGQEVYCRCNAIYHYALQDLPPDMLTTKGRAAENTTA
jgi:hypothetical protein